MGCYVYSVDIVNEVDKVNKVTVPRTVIDVCKYYAQGVEVGLKVHYVHHRYVHHRCGVAQSGLGRWTHNPEIGCSNPSPATKVEAYLVRGKVFSALSDVRGSVFLLRNATLLDMAVHAHVGFSMGLKRLSSWRFSGKGLFSGFIVSLASVELFRVGYRLLFSACMDVAVFVYGMVKYGNK